MLCLLAQAVYLLPRPQLADYFVSLDIEALFTHISAVVDGVNLTQGP